MGRKEQGPHFICIGPEKTGTTWLYRNLRTHPQVMLPHIKEFRYFNWHYSPIHSDSFRQRLFNNKLKASLSFRDRMKRRIRYYLKKNIRLKKHDLSSLYIDLKYWFGRRNDSWYLSFFRTRPGIITGDISPQYCRLDEKVIGHIRSVLPDLKIILLLRNPVDRVWSNAKMILSKQCDADARYIGDPHYFGFFNKEHKQTSSYLRILSRWGSFFPGDNIYVGFFDRLEEDPLGLFNEICGFLEIGKNMVPAGQLEKRVKEGKKFSIPERLEKFLARQYKKDIEELAGRYDSYPEKWLHGVQKILENGS